MCALFSTDTLYRIEGTVVFPAQFPRSAVEVDGVMWRPDVYGGISRLRIGNDGVMIVYRMMIVYQMMISIFQMMLSIHQMMLSIHQMMLSIFQMMLSIHPIIPPTYQRIPHTTPTTTPTTQNLGQNLVLGRKTSTQKQTILVWIQLARLWSAWIGHQMQHRRFHVRRRDKTRTTHAKATSHFKKGLNKHAQKGRLVTAPTRQ